MTHRESKAISDRINRKADNEASMKAVIDVSTLEEIALMHHNASQLARKSASESAYYLKAYKRRKMEAKKLTGSGDDRRTRIADGPETGGHVEASTAVDGVPASSEHGRRRSGDNA